VYVGTPLAAQVVEPTRATAGDEARPADLETRMEEAVEVGWVLVPVTVRGDGGYVRGLSREDFRLYVDGREVAIETFETGAEAPVAIAYLQDLSGSMGIGGKLDWSRQVFECLLNHSRSADQFAAASFGAARVNVDLPFTSDTAALRATAAGWEPFGTTALHDAVAFLPDLVRERASTKRAAVLVTDGIDNASGIDAEQARDIVRRSELPVYVLGIGAGAAAAAEPAAEPLFGNAEMLRLLAAFSGGRYYSIDDPADLQAACVDVLGDLRHQYVLGFATAGSGGAAHALKVEVAEGKDRIVTARRSYLGGAPAADAKSSAG
jgi:VWFA-related protein